MIAHQEAYVPVMDTMIAVFLAATAKPPSELVAEYTVKDTVWKVTLVTKAKPEVLPLDVTTRVALTDRMLEKSAVPVEVPSDVGDA